MIAVSTDQRFHKFQTSKGNVFGHYSKRYGENSFSIFALMYQIVKLSKVNDL